MKEEDCNNDMERYKRIELIVDAEQTEIHRVAYRYAFRRKASGDRLTVSNAHLHLAMITSRLIPLVRETRRGKVGVILGQEEVCLSIKESAYCPMTTTIPGK